MFPSVVVGLLMGLGIAAWVYNKIYRSTGGNTQNALTVGGVVGLLAFLVVVTLAGLLF